MQRLGRALKKIYASDYFPFLVLFVVMGVLHCFLGLRQGDDPFFSSALDNQGIADYLAFRYARWTSRFLIEAVMVTVLRSEWLWRALDVAALLALALSLSALVGAKRRRATNWLVCLGFLVYPFVYMNSAGWGATTINYLWPAAACAFALVPYKKALDGKRVGAGLGTAALIATAFAAGAEQFALLFVGLSTVLNAYLIRQKKAQPILIFQCLLAVAAAVFILICPGNANRVALETARWFPGFGSLGFGDKLLLGAAQTANYIFGTHNRVFLLLSGVLLASVWKRRRVAAVRSAAALPFVYSVFANISASLYIGVLPELQRLTTFGFSPGGESLSATRCVVLAFAGLGLCLAGFSLFSVYGRTKKSALFVFVFVLGLAGGTMMGFSPTVYASGLRTYFVTDMAFLFLGCSLGKDLLPDLTPLQKRLLLGAIAVLAALSLYDTFGVLAA